MHCMQHIDYRKVIYDKKMLGGKKKVGGGPPRRLHRPTRGNTAIEIVNATVVVSAL